jgi:ribosome-binding factor A
LLKNRSKSSKHKSSLMDHQQHSQRQLRVAELINHALVDCLRKGKVILGLGVEECPLTITKVNISADLRVAHCYFLPFNTTLTAVEITALLNKARYSIRHYVTATIKLKYSPEIRFHHDTGFENFHHINNLLEQIKSGQ